MEHPVYESVKYGKISHLYTKKGFINKGVASLLLKSFKEWLKTRSCKFVEVNVLALNPAKSFFANKSFKPYFDLLRKKL
jgi:GNAT superfamily N-acetyltransferase